MTKQIELHGKHGKGFFAIVDDEDYEWLSQYKWRGRVSHGLRYAVTTDRVAQTDMHKMITNTGIGKIVDHINRNSLDNRRENLREATYSQNSMNRISPRERKKTSRFKGVFFNKQQGRWQASITINKNTAFLGFYHEEIYAALAYNRKAVELFGEFALLNEIPDEYKNIDPRSFRSKRDTDSNTGQYISIT